MIFRGVPEAVFASPAKLAVLRELIRSPDTEMTGREIARRSNLSAPWTVRVLEGFEWVGLVRRRTVRPADLWRLNTEHALVPEVQRLLQADRRIWKSLLRTLEPVLEDRAVEKAVLFGSTARHEEQADSDVDLLVVVKDRRAQSRVRNACLDLRFTFSRRYGNPLHAIVYTKVEFERRRNLPLVEAARREGIILKGGAV
jgi:predicted nucleotidyltransferase